MLRVLLAVALFVRLGGIGREWLPSAPVLAAVLIAWLAALSLRGADVRAWRRRAGLDWFALGLFVIMALALLVRLPSLGIDLGRQPLDIDEHRLSASIKHFFVTGEIEHDTVEHYPGVVFWAMAAASLLSYLWGLMTGAFLSVQAMPVESFTFAGRLTNTLGAVATVGISGVLGRRLGGAGAALVSAALVAFVPLAVDTSTDMRNDPGQVLLLVATVWAALVAYDEDSQPWAIAAGTLAGLAAGVKYTSVFALVPALIAVLGRGVDRERLRRSGLVLAAFGATVALSNHFLWWDFSNFIRQLSDQVAITGPGHWAATANPAAAHRETLVRWGTGWPLLVIAAGWGAWVLATGRTRAWLFWSFPLLYSWFTTHRPSQFARWVYPLLPFVAIAGACGLMVVLLRVARWHGWNRVPRASLVRSVACGAVLAIALVPPFGAGAITISRRMTPSTAIVLEQWLRRSIPRGDVVLLEQGWLDLPDVPFSVVRVPDLEWVLGPGAYALSAADWIVVPEPHYGNPALGRLVQMQQVTADQRSLFGNLGYDYRVYVTPRLTPVQRVDVQLDDPAARPMLGWEWNPDARGQRGLLLPDRGASIFVPPLAQHDAAIALDVGGAGTAAQGLPLSLTIAGQEVSLADTGEPGLDVRRLSGRVRVPQTTRALEIRLDPFQRGARMRIVRLQVG